MNLVALKHFQSLVFLIDNTAAVSKILKLSRIDKAGHKLPRHPNLLNTYNTIRGHEVILKYYLKTKSYHKFVSCEHRRILSEITLIGIITPMTFSPGGEGTGHSAPLLHHRRVVSPVGQHLPRRLPVGWCWKAAGASQQPHLKQHCHQLVCQLLCHANWIEVKI